MRRTFSNGSGVRLRGRACLPHELVCGVKARSKFLTLGIGDDAALVSGTPGYEIVLTCDWFLEGTHFLRDKHPGDAVGWKCLARAVSDLAAMGAVPQLFSVESGVAARIGGLVARRFS